MGYLQALMALLPLLGKILDIFTKTPEEKREAFLLSMITYLGDVQGAVDTGKRTGDYKDLEDVINRRLK
jgi:hypothetical protein